MKKQSKNKQYGTTFKIKAILLSDCVGVKNAAAELGIPYRKLVYWRCKRERFGERAWSDKYLEKQNRKLKAKTYTLEERQRLSEKLMSVLNCNSVIKPHEMVVDTAVNRAPEFYKAPDYSTDDPQADYEEGDFLYNALDDKDAKPFLLRAAHAGIAAAQYELGCFYYYGTYDSESKPDLNLAEVWIREVLKNKTAGNNLLHCAEKMLHIIQTAKEWAKNAGQNTTSKH